VRERWYGATREYIGFEVVVARCSTAVSRWEVGGNYLGHPMVQGIYCAHVG